MIRFTLFWATALGLALTVHYASNDSAMTKCQETHSYDVCFQQLNR